MDVFDKILKEHSWKFPKGYPDMNDPKDKEDLFAIVESYKYRLKEEEKPTFDKQELIDFIQGVEDEDTLKKIFKFVKSSGFSKNLDGYLETKNLTDKDITYFISLLQDMDKLGEFAALATNPPKLDLSQKNFFTQIPSFTPEELQSLFTTMKDSIKGTVSLGPGENFLSVFFGNVSKEGKKGDLNIDGKEVELKARTGASGAVVSPRVYNRGDFSKSVKPFIEDVIKSLDLEQDQEQELNQINTPGGKSWTYKIDQIYQKYLEFGGNKEEFAKSLDRMLKEMYRTLNFNVDDYLSPTSFDNAKFVIDLAKKLAKDYYEIEKFDGAMFADFKGNFKYYPKGEFIDQIGKDIIVSYPTDQLPRLKI
jgi:hypothetical protein